MPRSVPLRRVLPATAALVTPAAAVLVILVAIRAINPLTAVAALGGVAVLTLMLVRAYVADLVAILNYVRELTRTDEARAPVGFRSDMAEELASAISQCKRAWQARHETMNAEIGRSETLIDSLPDPLIMLDEGRRVVRANISASRVFGRDMAGRDMAAVLRDPGILEAADSVLRGGPGRSLEFSLPSSTERVFRARVEPLARAMADGTAAVIALHDMTAVKRVEQMRADFVANASHELRTPLASLLGFIETLRGPARDDEEARERFLTIMYEQGSRMTRLVEDLLSLSRIEMNEHTQPVGRADLGRIVAKVAEGLEPQANRRNMKIVTSLDPQLPPVIGQADELAQLFQNLMDNALKYGHEGTEVEIQAGLAQTPPPGLKGRNGAIMISVRDHGDGIAPEHIPRLTERFFRVDTARSRKMGGTGLGLAIVKHVVNRHRGILDIQSTLGEGTTFTVYLPVAEAAGPNG